MAAKMMIGPKILNSIKKARNEISAYDESSISVKRRGRLEYLVSI
jgi:hypothetical protein